MVFPPLKVGVGGEAVNLTWKPSTERGHYSKENQDANARRNGSEY